MYVFKRAEHTCKTGLHSVVNSVGGVHVLNNTWFNFIISASWNSPCLFNAHFDSLVFNLMKLKLHLVLKSDIPLFSLGWLSVGVSAMVMFVKETTGEEVTGLCSNFQAVPGCGLKCSVSHISSMLKAASSSVNITNFNNQTRQEQFYLINIQ